MKGELNGKLRLKTNTTVRQTVLVTIALLFLGSELMAQTPPTILSQPTNVMANAGSTAIMSIGVSGTEPFSYQWYFDGTPASINATITTIVGNGVAGYSGDGGPAVNALLNGPTDVAVDAAGNLFIADNFNNRIRRVDTKGIITTVACGGDSLGDGGAATNALLSTLGIALDAAGNIFVADQGNMRIRKVETNGIITTVAGNGNIGYSGDGGAATNVSLFYPSGVAVDAADNVFFADSGSGRIRKVGTNGIITTVAGNGTNGYSGDGGAATNAELAPSNVALDRQGNLFITDYDGPVRKVGTNGIITTVASLGYSTGIAVDSADNLFITDDSNMRVCKVATNGIVTVVAGNGVEGYSGDGNAATNAELNYPYGVAVDATGNLFIADSVNNCVRKVTASNLSLDSDGASLILSNLTASNIGHYYVVVTNAYGAVSSWTANLSLAGVWPQSIDITLVNGSVALSYGGTASSNYIVWYTTSLTPPAAWIPLATNTADSSGNVIFVDTNAVGVLSRYYRVSLP